jgi:hypothetical protein
MATTTILPNNSTNLSPQKQKNNIFAQLKGVKHSISALTKRLSFCSLNTTTRPEAERARKNTNDGEMIATDSLFVEVPTSPKSPKLRFDSQVYAIPHPEKIKKGGEDAHFINQSGLAIGVADGKRKFLRKILSSQRCRRLG